MKVNLLIDNKTLGFLIEPETEFEAETIATIFQRNRGVDGYVKCGLTPKENT